MFDRVRSFVEYAEKQQAEDPEVVSPVNERSSIRNLLGRWETCLREDQNKSKLWDTLYPQ